MAALRGSGQEVGTVKPIECTYKNCMKRFDTIEEMKGHKRYADEHDYCKKCDIDFPDWEALHQHKVTEMDTYFRNRFDLPASVHPAHITCEFCGQDFRSFGGRKAHRAQIHPADQDIRCSGCDALFTRAANFIAHLEHGECPEISATEFRYSVVHKYIIKEIDQDFGEFNNRLLASKSNYAQFDILMPGSVTDGSEDQEDGGVDLNLLDEEHAEQRSGYPALNPQFDLLSTEESSKPTESQHSRAACETWPRIPGAENRSSRVIQSLRSLSTRSDASVTGSNASVAGSEDMSDVTSRRGGLKVHTDDEDTASDCGSDVTVVSKHPNPPWAGETSKVLFKSAKPPISPGDYAAIIKRKEEEILEYNCMKLLKTRFYDPTDKEYDVDRFFHVLLERYCCPFPQCDINECQYETPEELKWHLEKRHLVRHLVCPTCSKRFSSPTAQVSHMESAIKCRVKDSDKYFKLLDQISGGFLKAKKLDVPQVINRQQAMVVAGKRARANGVMAMQFKAKNPDEN
ncbi:hypothetical protein LTR27_007363 [Elasticomyces elasticus]|nr:hypothetical protein LTR27_007363 [Elasticomyces elasticus]